MQVQHSRYSAHIHRGGEQPVQSQQHAHCAQSMYSTLSSECPAVKVQCGHSNFSRRKCIQLDQAACAYSILPSQCTILPCSHHIFHLPLTRERGASLKGGKTCLGKGTKRRKKYRILTYLPETTYHRSLGQLRPFFTLFEEFVFCFPR